MDTFSSLHSDSLCSSSGLFPKKSLEEPSRLPSIQTPQRFSELRKCCWTHSEGLARTWKPPITCRLVTAQQYLRRDAHAEGASTQASAGASSAHHAHW